MPANDYILTLSCPDRIGIVHAVSSVLLKHQGNILDAQQFGDSLTNRFFLRVHFELPNGVGVAATRSDLDQLAATFSMDLALHDTRQHARLLILVSKQGHCLNDLLFRVGSGQLKAQIAGVASNHRELEDMVRSQGIPFHYLPITPDTRHSQEQQILELVRKEQIDLVVLARYMQILSTDLCHALQGRAINIHHSFLPSFKGAKPYHQAHDRGVKIIGATAHYVTADLDEGPIIEQDIERVSHRDRPDDLVRKGRDIERRVLARAVRYHLADRVMVNGANTVVFPE